MRQSISFDHTSVLETIARRFMSNKPPFMGARYAAAHDLSQLLGTELRSSQFLPFIPHSLVYGKLSLTIQEGSIAPDTKPDQQFRFEDTGDGFFFLRTLAGNMYLTVDVPLGANTGPGTTLRPSRT